MPSIGKRKNNTGCLHLPGISWPISVKHIPIFTLAALVLITACSGVAGAPAATPSPGLAPGQASETTLIPPPTAQSAPTAASAAGASSPAAPTPAEGITETAAASPTPEPAATEPPAAAVSSLPDPALFTWQPIAEGLESPIGLTNAGDGSARLFVIEQPGRVRLIKDGQLLPEPFLDLLDRVGSGGSEQGLLGLAFHPGYAQNGRFFVNYTDRNGDTIIARFTVAPDNPDRADPASEVRLLSVAQPYANHNGGVLAFGPDGYLYIGLGDGGAAGDPQGNGQSLDTLLGKVLRIDVDTNDPYGIPPDNPFASGGGLPEIWAYGLRNPWRFSFDRATGDLYLADVGQGSFEEVDFQAAGTLGGVNYGWDIMEGEACFNTPDCDPSGLTLPIFVYPTHVEGTCAVTGGYVYRGSLAAMQGIYLVGDYCSGRVWGLLPDGSGGWQSGTLFETGVRIASFGEDESGEIYLVSHSGEIYRLSGR